MGLISMGGASIEILLNCFYLSLVAAMIRVFLFPVKGFKDTVRTFVGGIIFGLLMGYLSSTEIFYFKSYTKTVTAVSSAFGRELFDSFQAIFKDPTELLRIIKGFIPNKKNDDAV